MTRIILIFATFILCISISFGQLQQLQEKPVLARAPVPATLAVTPGELTEPRLVETGCRVGGCYNELCLNLNDTLGNTCDYSFRNEFTCYQEAHCRMLENGRCAWDLTRTFGDCLENFTRNRFRREESFRRERMNEPLPTRCVTDGCFDEFCVDARLPPLGRETCDYRPEFECLRFSRCRLIRERCNFEMNPEFFECMERMRRRRPGGYEIMSQRPVRPRRPDDLVRPNVREIRPDMRPRRPQEEFGPEMGPRRNEEERRFDSRNRRPEEERRFDLRPRRPEEEYGPEMRPTRREENGYLVTRPIRPEEERRPSMEDRTQEMELRRRTVVPRPIRALVYNTTSEHMGQSEQTRN